MKPTPQHRPLLVNRQKGFSLFELVVFIICVAIIYAVAANRFSAFPDAAERANFMAIVSQIQSGINLQSMEYVVNSNFREAQFLDSANPMDFMLEAPSNYIGAFDLVDSERLPRRSWYFDRLAGHLVYLVNAEDAVILEMGAVEVPTDEIRFQLSVQYSYEDRRGRAVSAVDFNESGGLNNSTIRRTFRGIRFEAITPYRWEATGVDLSNIATTGPAG